ncbi:MAG: hypothetical protein Q8O38_12980 [Sulfurimicrobium sp.]|nr:hypothetical protein [Sulfurimicrobium sp.]
MVKRLIHTIIAAALGWAATQAAAAEMLPDPTRPPLAAGVAATGANATPDAGPVLQSVKIAPGRRSAVISGQLLAQGERFGAAKLVSISESEVVLLGAEGRQTLKLFPGVEKRVALPPQGQDLKPAKNKSKRNTEQKAP